MERQRFCDSGSVRGESVEPPSQTGLAGWADHNSGLGLQFRVQTAVQTVETRVQTVAQTVEKTYGKSTDRQKREERVLLNITP